MWGEEKIRGKSVFGCGGEWESEKSEAKEFFVFVFFFPPGHTRNYR